MISVIWEKWREQYIELRNGHVSFGFNLVFVTYQNWKCGLHSYKKKTKKKTGERVLDKVQANDNDDDKMPERKTENNGRIVYCTSIIHSKRNLCNIILIFGVFILRRCSIITYISTSQTISHLFYWKFDDTHTQTDAKCKHRKDTNAEICSVLDHQEFGLDRAFHGNCIDRKFVVIAKTIINAVCLWCLLPYKWVMMHLSFCFRNK